MRRQWLYKRGLILFFLAGQALSAQQRFEISAKEAIDLAFKNVAEIKNAKLDYQSADALNKEIGGMALPQVSASFTGNHYLT
ncbi:MAG: hypothetical protein ACHQEM_13405, partial [Chitinophagales bacterium]